MSVLTIICKNIFEIVVGFVPMQSRIFFINSTNLSCRIFRKTDYRAMFSNFHQKDRITIFLFLSLYV